MEQNANAASSDNGFRVSVSLPPKVNMCSCCNSASARCFSVYKISMSPDSSDDVDTSRAVFRLTCAVCRPFWYMGYGWRGVGVNYRAV